MPLTERENFLQTVTFGEPEWLPTFYMNFYLATWLKYGRALEELARRHPQVYVEPLNFPESPDELGKEQLEGTFRDNWGCVWHTAPGGAGLQGQVVEHPLADWAALETYMLPDPLTQDDWKERDWEQIRQKIEALKRQDKVAYGDAGCLFDRLYYLRGFENLMIDFASDAPQLPELIDRLEEHTLQVVDQWLKIGIDALYFHTDIAFNQSLMIRPEQFRRYIKPMYQKLFAPCRAAGVHVYLSSEGYLLNIVDDLVECGVSIQDAEVSSNTLEGIERNYKGRICVLFYPDAQKMPFWNPDQVRAHIREAVLRLGSPRGGLMIASYPTPDVPLENIEAMAQAIEEFRTYWWDGRGASQEQISGTYNLPDLDMSSKGA
jgi:uroporphyrinogen decarboxylase